jgi:putative ABC transport system permease protein
MPLEGPLIWNDLRYGFRLLLRRPAFAAIAILTLALGIGTTTAIFTVFDRVILRAIPFPEADRLVILWKTNPNLPVPVMVASPPTLHEWMTRSRSFTDVGAFRWRNVTLGGGEPEQVRGATVNASLLRALGVQPALGRLFLDDEDRPNAPEVVLISDGLFRRRFGADPNVLGRTIPIDGIPRQIVGVMPAGYTAPPPIVFRGTPPAERAELWLPLATDLPAGQRGAHNLTAIARLRPGVTVAAADADVKRIATEVGREHPDHAEWSARVVPLAAWVTESSRRSMTLLAAAVGFVLLLACANVANLLLARGVGRRREFAVRAAMGAGRARLSAQVIGESLALGLCGGIAGMVLAVALVRLIVMLGPTTIPGLREAGVDLRAIAFAGGVSVAAALLAGVVPATRVFSARLREWLNERGAGQGAAGIRVQQALVVSQVGLAMALLVTASLLVESFRQLRSVDPGFRAEQVITGKVVLPASRYVNAASLSQFVDRLLAETRALPGIMAAGVSDAVPMADNRQGTSFSHVDGPPADPSRSSTVNFAYVTDGFFDAMGIPLVSGRAFTTQDGQGARRVVVINQRLARQVFGDDIAIGRLVNIGVSTKEPFEVIGVVGDDRHTSVEAEPTPAFFVSYRQLAALREVALIARSEADATALTNSLRAVVRKLDSEMPFYQVRTMEQIVDASVATPRSLAWLLSGFAASGLLLAAIGVFGVLSHAVSQRTQEIGVRMAIGASPTQMQRMIVGEGLAQVGLGLVLGIALAVAASRLLSGLLYGVTVSSPAPYAFVAALLLVVAIAACLAPARRAMRVDPAMAIRGE